jgi:PleD family two-component response regulator
MDRKEGALESSLPVLSGTLTAREGVGSEDFMKFEGSRILLVDGDRIEVKVIKSILENGNMIVDVAPDAGKAYEGIEEFGKFYDIVLFDLGESASETLKIAKKIRADRRFRDMAIVVMADAESMPESSVMTRSGVNAFILKPLTAGHLYEILDIFVADRAAETLDTREGIANMNGDEELYRAILSEFVRNYSDSYTRLIEILYKGDMKKLEEFIVDLDGLSGTIGAKSLHALLQDMMRMLREDDMQSILASVAKFGNEMEKVLYLIDKKR